MVTSPVVSICFNASRRGVGLMDHFCAYSLRSMRSFGLSLPEMISSLRASRTWSASEVWLNTDVFKVCAPCRDCLDEEERAPTRRHQPFPSDIFHIFRRSMLQEFLPNFTLHRQNGECVPAWAAVEENVAARKSTRLNSSP